MLPAILLIAVALYLFMSEGESRVSKGVSYNGMEVGGFTEEEVKHLVRHMAIRVSEQPVGAEIDYEQESIVPEVNGREVDIEKTVSAVLEASPGEEVLPRQVEITPRVTWDDHPALPAYSGNPVKGCVSFMINVAWGEEYLEEMLRVLREEKVKATFFITGKWAEKNPELLKRIKKEGHELGNHGYSDQEVMPDLDWSEQEESLTRTNEIIYSLTGWKPEYFTPHRGEYNHLTLEMVSRLSMKTVLWSLDTADWLEPGVDTMEQKIKEKAAPGDIILMHPTEATAELLPRIIPVLRGKGLRIATIREHLSPVPPDAAENVQSR